MTKKKKNKPDIKMKKEKRKQIIKRKKMRPVWYCVQIVLKMLNFTVQKDSKI